jgi:hypothetical protein
MSWDFDPSIKNEMLHTAVPAVPSALLVPSARCALPQTAVQSRLPTEASCIIELIWLFRYLGHHYRIYAAVAAISKLALAVCASLCGKGAGDEK